MRTLSRILFLSAFFMPEALAAVVDAVPDSTLTLSAPSTTGVTVELPQPVRLVAGARKFSVVPVGSDAGEKELRPTNVRYFHIAAQRGAEPEVVTFVMGVAGQAPSRLHVRLTPQGRSDSFVTIRFAPKNAATAAGFIREEADFMRVLLRDADTNDRTIVNEPINKGVPSSLSIKLIRIFRMGDLEGRVFEVRNTSKKAVSIDPRSSVAMEGEPRMVHVDRDVLSPCKDSNSKDGDENCTTRMHFLMKITDGDSGLRIPKPPKVAPPKGQEDSQ